jgi:DNA polymerase (family 10)
VTKHEIADVLNEIALLLELKGENPFKVRAYQAGARVVESFEQAELERLVNAGELKTVKGIGDALGQKIAELQTTGKLEFFEKLKASVPPGTVELLQIPGLGPKKIKVLCDKLGVVDIATLTKACEEGRIADLAGFGAKTQEKILAGIKNREAYGRRHLWWEVFPLSETIVKGLRALPQVRRAESAGSLRRGVDTVGDLDFIVSATDVEPVVEWFVGLADVKEVTARGETKASIRFVTGLQADLRIVPDEQFVFALHHFTGSKDHNVQMRQRALARGLSLSEWGLSPVAESGSEFGVSSSELKEVEAKEAGARKRKGPKRAGDNESVIVANEADIFKALGLAFVPPELREGLGEIEAADAGEFPRLVEMADLRGTFHCHTIASDGRNTLSEMVAAAEGLGWDYFGIADHSKSSIQANGLSEERLLKQVAEIAALNASGRFKTHVFAGSECDILPDGRLDYDESVLRQLDYVVASVHSNFAQDETTMTARIIRAIEHPCTTMLGHLTGRILLRREAYKVDARKVIDAAIANNVIIEINASPWRLDMEWRQWRKAAERGLVASINPDAHETGELAYVRAGVNVARKGWLTKENVFNTRELGAVKKAFAERNRAR